jgi:hypothetical protein
VASLRLKPVDPVFAILFDTTFNLWLETLNADFMIFSMTQPFNFYLLVCIFHAKVIGVRNQPFDEDQSLLIGHQQRLAFELSEIGESRL